MNLKMQSQSELMSEEIFYTIIDFSDGSGSTRETSGDLIKWVEIVTNHTQQDVEDFCQTNGLSFEILS